jgi:enoyl-CoA hydratase/carnithine racemase
MTKYHKVQVDEHFLISGCEVSRIELKITESLATISMNRSDKKNAFDQEMWKRLEQISLEITADSNLKIATVESSSPGIFSAGADVSEYREHAGDGEWAAQSQAVVAKAIESVRAIPIPTIAVIDGPCFGGGAALAVACDFRISSTNSTFAITPAKLGMVYPYSDIVALTDLVGPAIAKQLLFTSRTFSATEASAWGYVDELTSSDEIESTRDKWISWLMANSSSSIRSMKTEIELVLSGQREDSEQTLGFVKGAMVSPDHAEGIAAFLEKRTAKFQ